MTAPDTLEKVVEEIRGAARVAHGMGAFAERDELNTFAARIEALIPSKAERERDDGDMTPTYTEAKDRLLMALARYWRDGFTDERHSPLCTPVHDAARAVLEEEKNEGTKYCGKASVDRVAARLDRGTETGADRIAPDCENCGENPAHYCYACYEDSPGMKALEAENAELKARLAGLRASLSEALNQGDGSYKP